MILLAYLQQIDAKNQALKKKVDDLESQRINHSTVQAAKATLEQGPPAMPIMTQFRQPGHQHSAPNSLSSSQAGYPQAVANSTSLSAPAAQMTHNVVIPDANAIRANPTISQSVSHILSSLEAGSRTEAIQGKVTHKKIRQIQCY